MAVTTRSLDRPTPFWRRVNIGPLLTAAAYLLALFAAALLLTRGAEWAQGRLDDARYGWPRTVHLSGVVGGGDSPSQPTRFIGLNLDGQISVLVAPAGDTSRLSALPGPYVIGRGGDAAVPLLALDDLTGDGAPDLLLTLRGETVVYVNHDGTFALITPDERAQLGPPAGDE